MKNQATQATPDNPYAGYLELDESEEVAEHGHDAASRGAAPVTPPPTQPGWVNASGAPVDAPFPLPHEHGHYQAPGGDGGSARPVPGARRARPVTPPPMTGRHESSRMSGSTKLIIWGSVGLTVVGIGAVLTVTMLSSGSSGKRTPTLAAMHSQQATPPPAAPGGPPVSSAVSPSTQQLEVPLMTDAPSQATVPATVSQPHGQGWQDASVPASSGATVTPLPVAPQPTGYPLEVASPSPAPSHASSSGAIVPALQPFADLATVINVFNHFRHELLSQRQRLERIEEQLASARAPAVGELEVLKSENDKLTTQLKKLEGDNENLGRMLAKVKGENRELRTQIASLREKTAIHERRAVLPGWEVVGLTDTHVALMGPQNVMRVVRVGEQFSGVTFLAVNTETGVVRTDAGEMRYAGVVARPGPRSQ